MIELYFWPTPNGHKISIMLEECGLEYDVKPVDIGRGDQFDPSFLRVSPNNRMPAIVDSETGVAVFESGAILLYLAEKTGLLLPEEESARYEALQWLFWQVGGLGPMAGQLSHFSGYALEDVKYARKRYFNEYDRLLAVMDVRLRKNEYLAGDYSIADIAALPWVKPCSRYGNDLARFGNLRTWFERLMDRDAVQRGFALGAGWKSGDPKSDAVQSMLFGQDAETVWEAHARLQN